MIGEAAAKVQFAGLCRFVPGERIGSAKIVAEDEGRIKRIDRVRISSDPFPFAPVAERRPQHI